MALGYDREQNVVNIGDSVELYAYLYGREDNPVLFGDLASVRFVVQRPDGTKSAPLTGEIQSDDSDPIIPQAQRPAWGYLRYTDTTIDGEYVVVATFTFVDGGVKSTRDDFEVLDPFEDAAIDATSPDWNTEKHWDSIVTDRVWRKIQDLFDSQDGGPWMMDMTLNVFSPHRIKDFIEEALFDINVYNPPTNLGKDYFANMRGPGKFNENLTVLVQGTLITVIRHLMRTYAEQPSPQGGQVTYEDRRDYLQRWGTIYQIEFQHYDHLVKMWKRTFLGLNQSKQLVSSKAGRLLPAPLRTRNIGRGYYAVTSLPLLLFFEQLIHGRII